MHRRIALCVLSLTFAIVTCVPALSAAAPFIVTASSGPAVGAQIVATVTRSLGKSSVTLPAALVPALRPGDVVDIDFPDYRRPPGSVNYHVNAAFITEAAPQHWLFERSTPEDRLFVSKTRSRRSVPLAGRIHFTYGAGTQRGIPLFFIIPEDGKTRGVDGVRDYVGAHPSDFVAMAQSTNAAVDRYSFLSDFLGSLGNGSLDPSRSRQRIESIAQSLGVSATAIDGCYALGGTTADVRNCIQRSINTVVYQTNFSAPTQAQFLGGIAGAVNPVAYAPYIASLITVWKLFVHTGHQEYEFLPTTVSLADPTALRHEQLLMGLKVPTLRPPAAFSDVLFFTIGDPQGNEHPPVAIDEAPASGTCARTERFTLPLHFDHTSRYVHDTALVVTPDGGTPFRIPLDPRSLSAPVVTRAQFDASPAAAYTVALQGAYGFDPVGRPERHAMRLAFPTERPWTVANAPHRTPQAGGALDLIAASPAAACLTRAELQIGSAPPIALTASPLDSRRVALHASLADVPAGPAVVRFYQDDPRAGLVHESAAAVAIAPPPSHVDPKSAVVSAGDTFVRLAGSGFEQIARLVIGRVSYGKTPDSTATSACFMGPPITAGLVGQQLTGELFTTEEANGEVFPLTVAMPRPQARGAEIVPSPAATLLATAPISVTLRAVAPLPRQLAVRVRKAPSLPGSPCDVAETDPTAITLPDTAVHVLGTDAATVTLRADVLRDRAFGTLQLQLVDTAAAVGGEWISLPATFARAPAVTQIACPTDPKAPCRLYGTGLAAIDAIDDGTGTFASPDLNCPPTDKGLACVYVPHVSHYRLRLTDAGTIEDVPDALIASAVLTPTRSR